MKNIDHDKLYNLYWKDGLSIQATADKLGVTFYRVISQMIKHQIPRRPAGTPTQRVRPWVGERFLKKGTDKLYRPIKHEPKGGKEG